MKLYVGITDYHWFHLHAAKDRVDEVNFWRPSSKLGFNVLQWGEPFLFKLHSPRNYIVGGGFFTKYIRLPVSLAWETFGEANGATTLEEVRTRLSKYRRRPIERGEDPQIGCVLLEEPFFFDQDDWIQSPPDFKAPTQMGKSYDMQSGTGLRLWQEVTARLEGAVAQPSRRTPEASLGPSTIAALNSARFGAPQIVTPRLGQGSFRVLIADAYGRRCTMTAERTFPALEAAHIQRYSRGGTHELSNGLLLRSDLHKLFDLGYISVDPYSMKIKVSRKIREEYENGRDYYRFENTLLRQPHDLRAFPSLEKLRYHYDNEFRG